VHVAAWWLLTRLVVFSFTVLGGLTPRARIDRMWAGQGGLEQMGPKPDNWLEFFIRWDVFHYVPIARLGYPAADGTLPIDTAFFPLFPLLIRALTPLLGSEHIAGMCISNVCSLGAAYVLASLHPGDSRDLDRRIVILFLAAPAANFLSYTYTEGLFALLLAGAMWMLYRQHLVGAALLGALATGTRTTGIAVPLMIMVAAWPHRHDRMRVLKHTVAAAVGCGGLLAYSAFCWNKYGNPFIFMDVQQHWQRKLSLLGPFKAFLNFNADPDFYLAAVVALWVSYKMVRRVDPPTTAASWMMIMLPLSSGTLGSMVRYQSNNLPMLAGAAQLVEGRAFKWVVAVCLTLLAYSSYRYGAGFPNY